MEFRSGPCVSQTLKKISLAVLNLGNCKSFQIKRLGCLEKCVEFWQEPWGARILLKTVFVRG